MANNKSKAFKQYSLRALLIIHYSPEIHFYISEILEEADHNGLFRVTFVSRTTILLPVDRHKLHL